MFGPFFGEYLLNRQAVTREQLDDAASLQRSRNRYLGQLALERGMLTEAQLQTVLQTQRRRKDLFGEVACSLGHLTETQVDTLLALQAKSHVYIGQALVEVGAMDTETLDVYLNDYNREVAGHNAAAVLQTVAPPYGTAIRAALETASTYLFRLGYPFRISDVQRTLPDMARGAAYSVSHAHERTCDDDAPGGCVCGLWLPLAMVDLLAAEGDFDDLRQTLYLMHYLIAQASHDAGATVHCGPLLDTPPDPGDSAVISFHGNTLFHPMTLFYIYPSPQSLP